MEVKKWKDGWITFESQGDNGVNTIYLPVNQIGWVADKMNGICWIVDKYNDQIYWKVRSTPEEIYNAMHHG